MRVVVLHDEVPEDAPPDQIDTLVQAGEVSRALARLGHEPMGLGFSLPPDRTAAQLRKLRPDLVFNLVESPNGSGRFIHLSPQLLDSLGLPYVGAKTEAMRRTSNKLEAKEFLQSSGLPTPAWLPDGRSGPLDPEAHYVIKSVWEHGSVGLDGDSVLPGSDPQRLLAELERRRSSLGGECFVEEYIEGREFNLSLLAGEVLPPAETIFDGYTPDMVKVVGYRAKWLEDSYEYHHTLRLFDFPAGDKPLLRKIRRLARLCWKAFELRGWARVDFRVDSGGGPFILEVNADPCLSSDAGFMAAAERAGLDQEEVVSRIIEDAERR
ncbi:MAG: D-alanine--D-alanine ligase [Pseudomonadota bacterium]